MTPERLQKIRNLFEAALEQDAAERERFVEHASRNDSELRAEVLRMLEAHQRANGYLSRPAADLTGTTQVHAAERVFAAGDVVANRFDIVDLLGAGGMGEVYRARDRKLHRDVALKVVLHQIYVSSYQRARFEREARAASALNHPNIATVYDLFEESAVQFIAMELVRGRTLAELIPSGGMPVEQAIEYAAQIADALKAAHAAGIVHRDMKPRNVAITETGTVKVLDFGLAKLVDRALEEEPESVSETASGLILGTAAYMSPEQAEGGPVDHRSDIFSFGAVLYEMLTGRRAFEGSSPASVIAAVLKEEPRFPQELATSIPVELQRLVMRCLRKDIETRSQRMSDIRVALDEVRNGSKIVSSQGAFAPITIRSGRVMFALGVLAVLAAAALFWYFARDDVSGYRLVQVTFEDGITGLPALSPDGKLIVYSSDRATGQNLDLWVQQVTGGGAVRLTTDSRNELFARFSPDGNEIAFMRENDGVYAMPSLGGPERLIAKDSAFPAYSPDGKWIAYIKGLPGSEGAGVFLTPAAGGPHRRLGTGLGLHWRPIW